MSWRLYFITGHWPVVKTCDFAQPRPMRMLSDPDLGVLVDAARIAGHVQAGDAEARAGPGDGHDVD